MPLVWSLPLTTQSKAAGIPMQVSDADAGYGTADLSFETPLRVGASLPFTTIMSQNASTSSATVTELEMSRGQRELVNSCWEENQYESGIAVLEQLRSPRHKPSPYA